MFACILFTAAFCSFVESIEIYPELDDFTRYFEQVFLILISISIIGFSTPVYSDVGKAFITVALLVFFTLFPKEISTAFKLFASKSPYARARYKKINMNVPHIVIIGDISHSALVDFLNEYFNKDHGDHKRHCVILQNCIPSIDIQTSINDPQYKQQV